MSVNVRLLPLFLLFVSNSLFAEVSESVTYGVNSDRPNFGGDPTLVGVNFYLIDIDSIDDANKRFGIDFFLNVSWQDSRLAIPESQRTGRSRTIPLDEIWSPRGLIVNDRGLRPQLPFVAAVDDEGRVQLRQRYAGQLAVDMDLREFPFDVQRLPIEIVSYQYSPDQLLFSSVAAIGLGERNPGADGWHFSLLEPEVGEFKLAAAGIVRPQLTFVLEARRDSFYILMTTMLPISLILFMAWTAFWLQPDIIPSRIGITTAAIFSLIAFGVSIRLSLPPVSYLTRTDIFLVGSMFMVFLALAVTVIGSRWANSDRMEKAQRLNAFARWAYAGLFGVVALTAYAIDL